MRLTQLRRALTATLGLVLTAATVLTAGAAAGASTMRAGYALEAHNLIGYRPGGFHVYITPTAANRSELRSLTAGVVRDLRAHHLPVTFYGYGNRSTTASGYITVTTGTSGCHQATEGATWANTWPSMTTLRNGWQYMDHSHIVVCPSVFRQGSGIVSRVLYHEFGHAMGLGHYAPSYAGHYQAMYPGVHWGTPHYEAGDWRGMAWLNSHTTLLRKAAVGTGDMQKLTWTWNGTVWEIYLTGWGKLGYYRQSSARIVVTLDGRTVRTDLFGQPNRAWASGTARTNLGYTADAGQIRHGRHMYCAWLTSASATQYQRQLGCMGLNY